MASMEAIFKQFLKKIQTLQQVGSDGQSGFSREFQSLRQTSLIYKADKTYSTEAGECSTNRVKNRFKDILPFDFSRVKLRGTGVEGSDYINANHIKGVNNNRAYIASQGPLPNTVNDFWRMLWEYKVKVVVMLCRENENGKKKCQRYWCENGDKLNFGGITVKTKKVVLFGNSFTMRTLVAEFQGEEQILTQFHYTAWPDHGVPSTTAPLIELVKLIREYQPENDPPLVFHCSAGCGRTGTICALDYCQMLLKQTRAKELDPYRIVENLRKQRPAMVQTKGQYEFLCRAMCALFREKLNFALDEELDDHLYENVTSQSYSDSDSDTSLNPGLAAPSDHVGSKSTKERCPIFVPPGREPNGGQKSPVTTGPPAISERKRVGKITQQPTAGDNYVNVAFDLIDLSDDTPSGNSTNSQPSAEKPRVPKSTSNQLRKGLPKFPEKADSANGNGQRGKQAKTPITRQTSFDDYAVPNKFKSPVNFDETSDYVVAPPRGNQLPTTTSNRSLEKTKNASGNSSGQRYENVPPINQSPPGTKNRSLERPKNISGNSSVQKYENVQVPAAHSVPQVPKRPPSVKKQQTSSTINGQTYENVEVPLNRTANPERKSPGPVSPRPMERTVGKPGSPVVPTRPENHSGYHRSKSTSDASMPARKEREFFTYGPKSGAKMTKVINEMQRAKVLPNESIGEKTPEDANPLEQQFFNDVDVNNGLYASVGTRKKSARRHIENTDSVDGDRPPEVPKKPSDLHVPEECNVVDTKSKSLSLTNKLPFLSKKSEPEAKVLQFGNIGYGKRVAKPKGPRNPPKSWMVKT